MYAGADTLRVTTSPARNFNHSIDLRDRGVTVGLLSNSVIERPQDARMISPEKHARAAGLWYLLMAITGGFGIMYVPMNILVAGDATATAQNIVAAGSTYQLSIASGLIGQAAFVFLALALYRLFQDVDRHLSRLLVALVTAAVPIGFVNYLNLIAARVLVSDSTYLQAFETVQLQSLAMSAVNLYSQGILIVQVFWGLWLLPLGLLFVRAAFMPSWLGILLVANCFAYLIITFTQLLEFPYVEVVTYTLMPFLLVGEFAAIFWLLFLGVKSESV
jgi:hypothetical protein